MSATETEVKAAKTRRADRKVDPQFRVGMFMRVCYKERPAIPRRICGEQLTFASRARPAAAIRPTIHTTIHESFRRLRKFSGEATLGRSAGFQTGFQTCRIADFPICGACDVVRSAGLETRDTADLEVCATSVAVAPMSQFV